MLGGSPYTEASMETQNLLSVEQKQFFDTNGYIILERFFNEVQVSEFKQRIDHFWMDRGKGNPLTIDCYLDRKDPNSRWLFREVHGDARNHPYKLNDTHLVDGLIQEFSISERLAKILKELLGAPASVCNSLLFERGSQQGPHFDTFYMPSKTPNKMCASWIAIDPVTDANGPLFYYPGSHLMEPYKFSDGTLRATQEEFPKAMDFIRKKLEEHDLKAVHFYPNPGDVLIWHAQLLHGGSAIKDMSQTRASLVTHYWTTLDFPDPTQHIDLGDGRLILKKPHQAAISREEHKMVDEFVNGLTTPKEHRVGLPLNFDPRSYLLMNPDVFRAAWDPYTHYKLHGQAEGRKW
ncbi:ectoine hydroxylase-related dioxygenase (phytanoyl-CoA dioxygenase family) [Variovorax paradoxus]|nr:ectoine hydroxylase-related dioxygenase (phytanoyl-CoA dioxygenase family) [Variovorax paradoxus]